MSEQEPKYLKHVDFWMEEDLVSDFDDVIRDKGFSTRAAAIRYAMIEQMKRWKAK
mgnify:CR=1 FL=1